MQNKLFEHYSPIIRSLSANDLNGSEILNEKMRLLKEDELEVCYVPFEYINPRARVVIVGITPGRTQMINAIKEARMQLDSGAGREISLIAAKRTGAFSGQMRPNLIALLDHIELNIWLGISSCSELFDTAAELVQTTSVLRNPVFVRGENYNGTPSMIKHPILLEQMLKYFGEDVKALPNAVYVPLGDKVTETLHYLANLGLLERDRILDGLPHPSGANAERIAYFLGRKERGALSSKTNPEKIDIARKQLIETVRALI